MTSELTRNKGGAPISIFLLLAARHVWLIFSIIAFSKYMPNAVLPSAGICNAIPQTELIVEVSLSVDATNRVIGLQGSIETLSLITSH